MNLEDEKLRIIRSLSEQYEWYGDIEQLHSAIDLLAIELHEFVDEELK